ncbi:hypothetical protein RB596_003854 [Gaeumannomyces avenae]
MAVGSAGLLVPVFAPLTALTLAYTGHQLSKLNWMSIIYNFLTGPGRVSRITLLIFLVMNRKNLPFAWTTRVLASLLRHAAIRRSPGPPRVLYHYSITRTHAPLLETDYNFHKSNSTYFSDLDVSRSHLLMHLFAQGMERVTKNAAYKVVKDKEGNLIKGGFGIGLGSVFCSFKREIAPYSKYEMWSRVLCFDRKWLYILTHFVDAGKVRPTRWDGKGLFRGAGKVRPVGGDTSAKKTTGNVDDDSVDPSIATTTDFQKHVFATAVSKYVFKLGRFTVHPAIVIEESGLLPERPGGWRGGPSETGTPEDLSGFEEELALSGSDEESWDWRRTEWERRKGMAFADHFAALDGMHTLFDGGDDGALGHFRPA